MDFQKVKQIYKQSLIKNKMSEIKEPFKNENCVYWTF